MSWKNVENYLLGFLVIITSELQRGEARFRGEGAAPERMVQIIQILIYQRQHFYMKVDKLFLNVIWHEIIFFKNMIDFHTL